MRPQKKLIEQDGIPIRHMYTSYKAVFPLLGQIFILLICQSFVPYLGTILMIFSTVLHLFVDKFTKNTPLLKALFQTLSFVSVFRIFYNVFCIVPSYTIEFTQNYLRYSSEFFTSRTIYYIQITNVYADYTLAGYLLGYATIVMECGGKKYRVRNIGKVKEFLYLVKTHNFLLK